MHEHELFFLKKEVSRLLKDFIRSSDPICKELIRQEVLFLCTVIANNEQVPVD
ncbi:hypothetical protein [Bacillus sp. ISL-7]|uniref:hypothetical protein n=1 Tax=Bacillus sp. ISL-7 TaxID=2819136 RepID=UPI001BE9DF6C|nr:hypothetical protein [Bacillus sp. ISL-7]MBT2733695.1 hypothetical protein [Bacillus sp. ISL-7]